MINDQHNYFSSTQQANADQINAVQQAQNTAAAASAHARVRRLGLSFRILLVFAVILLLAGGFGVVQSTQAQLSILSDDYVAEISQSHIGVALTENGTVVEGDGALFSNPAATLGNDKQMIPGKEYAETISVVNETDEPEYVRVTIRRYWANEKGVPNAQLDPRLIDLRYDVDNWVLNLDECTKERLVFYLKEPLAAHQSATTPVVYTVKLNTAIYDDEVELLEEYEGYTMHLAAQVDSIQTNYAHDAARSAWGVDTRALGLEWNDGGAQ